MRIFKQTHQSTHTTFEDGLFYEWEVFFVAWAEMTPAVASITQRLIISLVMHVRHRLS